MVTPFWNKCGPDWESLARLVGEGRPGGEVLTRAGKSWSGRAAGFNLSYIYGCWLLLERRQRTSPFYCMVMYILWVYDCMGYITPPSVQINLHLFLPCLTIRTCMDLYITIHLKGYYITFFNPLLSRVFKITVHLKGYYNLCLTYYRPGSSI